jgi:hypothetical protein
MKDEELSLVTDEWKLYALDDVTIEAEMKPHLVDEYWAKILGRKNSLGELKYTVLGKVVKACLSLSHGNSDAERSFSANKRTVTPERARLGEETINALRLVKDALRLHGEGNSTKIIIQTLCLYCHGFTVQSMSSTCKIQRISRRQQEESR